MCGGLVGEAIGGIDRAANSINPMKGPMQKLTDNTIGKIPGVGKVAARTYDYSNSHPLESLAAMVASYYGGAALGSWGEGGAGAAEAGAGAGAGEGTSLGMGGYTSAYDAELGGEGVVGGAGAGAGGGADVAGLEAADSSAVTSEGAAPGLMGNGGVASQTPGWLQSLQGFFKTGVGGTGGGGNSGTRGALGVMQLLSSIYGMDQSRKLSKQASSQSVSNAGLQAVQRSMAAQGYQGSGNMMTALSKYGADAYGSNLAQKQASLQSTMSGLGLLTAGIGNLQGWGSTGGTGG